MIRLEYNKEKSKVKVTFIDEPRVKMLCFVINKHKDEEFYLYKNKCEQNTDHSFSVRIPLSGYIDDFRLINELNIRNVTTLDFKFFYDKIYKCAIEDMK